MKTKVVYVLVSDYNDCYLEQTLLSVYSLRLHTKNTIVELVVDKKTDQTITGSRTKILEHVDKKIVVDLPGHFSKVETSRIIKTSLRKYIHGDYLFVDSDTIITDALDEIDEFDGIIGSVLNLHVPLELHSPKDEQKVRNRIKQVGFDLKENIPYYNSGVIFVRDCKEASDFYELWHKKWHSTLESHKLYKDQPSFAVANAESNYIIKELDGIWNCQILNNGLPYLSKAKIIHYFASIYKGHTDTPYFFLDTTLYKSITEKEEIPNELTALIKNAKGAFVKPCMIIAGDDVSLITDNVHSIAKHHKKLYSAFNSFIGLIFSFSNYLKKIFCIKGV